MKWILLLSIFFLQACSNLPVNIKNAPSTDLQFHHVLSDSASFQNQPVRWGGTVIDVVNKAQETELQIMYYPLNYYGRPLLNKSPSGRFLSISKQFLDPALYTTNTEITIAGSIQGTVEKTIGEKIITMPIIAIDNYHIWPKFQQNYYRPYDPPYFEYEYRYHYYPYSIYRSRYRYYNCY